MDTLKNYTIPPIDNEDTFENFCRDLYENVWIDIKDFKRFGRSGQVQNGVDLYGYLNNKWYAIQCKQKGLGKELTEFEVDAEIKKALDFKPKLDHYLFATTAPRDAKIQEYISQKNDEHKKKGLFTIAVDSWDDIEAHLDKNRDIFQKYFPQFQAAIPNKSDGEFKIPSEVSKEIVTEISNKIPSADGEHHAELDGIKKLIESKRPKSAKKLLDDLKDRVWSRATPDVKYRITTNLGSIHLSLGEERKAALLFKEALNYKRDENALYNAATGCLILGELDKARDLCEECLEKYPSYEQIYLVKVQVNSELSTMEQLVDMVPPELRKKSDILYALSFIAQKKGLSGKAIEWAQEAVDNAEKHDNQIKENLARMLISNAQEKAMLRMNRVALEEDHDDLKKSSAIYEELIGLEENEELVTIRPWWFVNFISAKLLLGDKEAAKKLVSEAMRSFPDDPKVIFQTASVFANTDLVDEAISALESLPNLEKEPTNLLFLAELQANMSKYIDAQSNISKVLKMENLDPRFELDARKMKAGILIRKKEFSEAEKKIEEMLAEKPSDVSILILKAELLNRRGDQDGKLETLNEAYECVTYDLFAPYLETLAVLMFQNKVWSKAEVLYEKLIGDSMNHQARDRLLYCYYKLGKFDKVIKFCNKILSYDQKSYFATETLSAIYEQMGNLSKAKEVCRSFLAVEPNNSLIRLRLGTVARRDDDFELVKEILAEDLDTEGLSLENLSLYSHLVLYSGEYKRAVEIQYLGLARFKRNPKAHMAYFGAIFAIGYDKNTSFEQDEVVKNSAVSIDLESDGVQMFVITDENEDLFENELYPHDDFAKKLLGKKVGDEIKITRYSEINAKIIDIKHKHLAAHQKLSSEFNKRFPMETGFELVPAPTNFTARLPEKFKKILERQESSMKRAEMIFDMYKDKKITMGALSNFLGKDYVDTCEFLTVSNDFKLYTSSGIRSEDVQVIHTIQGCKIAVLELSSLLTIHWLKIEGHIESLFDEILVNQTLIDQIRKVLPERRVHLESGKLTTWGENGKLKGSLVSIEQVSENIKFYEKVLKWIEEKCKIEPVPDGIYLEQSKRKEMAELIGDCCFDAILTTKVDGRMLLSDDYLLRALARNSYGVENSSNVKSILDILVSTKTIDQKRYREYILDLVSMNYSFLPVDAEVLKMALERDEYLVGGNFKKCMAFLGAESDFRSAIVVASSFIILLWHHPIPPLRRNAALIHLLNNVSEGRKVEDVRVAVSVYVDQMLKLSPVEVQRIKKFIEGWELSKIIV